MTNMSLWQSTPKRQICRSGTERVKPNVVPGTYKVRNEIETKRNETKRNQRKRNETKRNQRNGNEMKRNQRNKLI